ncbi:polyprenyl synthetase family protein [Nakamurella antarctica]|uniref:Polyprenyl synthetase family protein n=1 Tax=Nakamurella antarctica TaxID=1902245 RepID=A0A3G8ZKR5_9ACTN|nr:polyprenyl synthetase family protein [Nakamurella antarctica]AZI57800.1 polyprenyl synthetase family protein [Nakamurella antarctica]
MHSPANILDVPRSVTTLLAAELASRRADVSNIDPRLGELVDHLITFTLQGGKRLRPQFLIWGWRAVRPDSEELQPALLRAAASLELIQTCALMHDDIIDRSETRRGEPSTHRAVTKGHAGQGLSGDGDHFGTSLALLLGDLALAWADDMFTEAALALGRAKEAMPVWRAMRTEVLAGQMLDVATAAANHSDPALQAADAMAVNRYKTAAYTVERPLHLGATLAGGSEAVIAALRSYGEDIGIAFQLRDDQLGVFGEPSITGKPAGDDLVEGKRTLLLARARADLEGMPELAELDAGIGAVADAQRVGRLTSIIAGTTAVQQIESCIAELHTSGVAALADPSVDRAAATALTLLAAAATTRTF